MKKLLIIVLLIAVVLICIASNPQWRPTAADPAGEQNAPAQDATSSAETPEPVDMELPADTPQPVDETEATLPVYQGPPMLLLEIPDRMQAGMEVPGQVVMLAGPQDFSELYLEIHFPISFIYVLDADPGTEDVVQVTPLVAEPAVVEINEVDPTGRLSFKVTNLASTGDIERALFSMRLITVYPTDGAIPIEFGVTSLKDMEGNHVAVNAQAKLVEVLSGPVDTEPILDPTPAPTLEPTPEPTLEPTPEPTAEPTVIPADITSAIAPGIYYRIQRGQTLYQVAEAFGSTPDAIAQANGIIDVTRIPVNTLLRIPVSPPRGQAAYYVAPRETLYGIAQSFDFSVRELAALNGIPEPHAIEANQWIVLVP